MDKEIIKNTIRELYPLYAQRDILKRAVKENIILNDRKQFRQLAFNTNGSIDVANDENEEKKLCHMVDFPNGLALLEAYAYTKPYRHFCYFEYADLSIEKIKKMIDEGVLKHFDKIAVDEFDFCSVYIVGEKLFFKFPYRLKEESGNAVKYIVLAILDQDHNLLEIRFDKIGIAYKHSITFYKEKIDEVLDYLSDVIGLKITNIDFKAVVEYIKSEKDDVTILAKRMTRNGTTAYLEAYEDEMSTIPILGELDKFIKDQKALLDKNEDTKEVRQRLIRFMQDIEIKSDMPLVKIKLDKLDIKFEITHNYKNESYSLFMLYGQLVGEEMVDHVKKYLMQCYREYRDATSNDSLPTEESQ